MVDLNDAFASRVLNDALKLLRDDRAADTIQGFFGLKDLGREVLAK